MHDAQIEIEFVLRRLASVKSQRNRSVEFVVERLETIEDLAEDVVPRERLHRVEWRRGAGSHGSGTEGLRIKMRRDAVPTSPSPKVAGGAAEKPRGTPGRPGGATT